MNLKKLLAVVPLSLALVACGGKNASTSENTAPDKNNTAQATEEKTENNTTENQITDETKNADEKQTDTLSSIYVNAATKLTGSDAALIFTEKYPDAQIEAIEYDTEEYKYEISAKDADKEYEMKINPETGEVISEEFENDRDDDKFLDFEQIAKAEDLLHKALSDAGEGFLVKSWDMDFDDNIYKIDIELKNSNSEIEYSYNVDTGDLVEKDN